MQVFKSLILTKCMQHICHHRDGIKLQITMWFGLQGTHIPRLLAQGAFHRGLVAFTATSTGGDPLSCRMLQACPQLVTGMKKSLAAVHSLGVVHGDVALHNFVLAPGHTNINVWVLDFESSHFGNAEEQKAEMEHLADLLKLAAAHGDG